MTTLTTQQIWADLYRLYRAWEIKQSNGTPENPLNNGHNTFVGFFHELESFVTNENREFYTEKGTTMMGPKPSGTRWADFYYKLKAAYEAETGRKVGI